jgi:hypothetical protein
MKSNEPAQAGRADLPEYYNVRLHHNRHLIVAIHAACVAKVGKHRGHWEITDTLGRRWLTDHKTKAFGLQPDPCTRTDIVLLVDAAGVIHRAGR